MHDYDLAGINNHRDSRQLVTGTRTCNTVAIIEAKQGIMRCTLDEVLVKAHELIRHPVKRATRVRTTVQVSENLLTPPHDKHIVHLFIQAQRQPPAIRVLQFIKLADDCLTGSGYRHTD